ncbi:receptor-like protein kinase bri1-like 3 [Quercus suber]|uniref:non-specific serine/threonine protein kinase n=1 Tax=Quercus suber TaxID=58331 RepID=A0AAW0IV85_QUESU
MEKARKSWNPKQLLSHHIIEAIEDFDIDHCIGTDNYGSVYKAQLSKGKVAALKKLHCLRLRIQLLTRV